MNESAYNQSYCGKCHCPTGVGCSGLNGVLRQRSGGYCKECRAKYNKTYLSKPEGRARKMWVDMNRRAENRDGDHPSYKNVRVLMSQQEFLSWAVPAIRDFCRSNPDCVPSIDRINPDGNYAFGNIRIISYLENSRLARRKTARRRKAQLGLPWHPDPPFPGTPTPQRTKPPEYMPLTSWW